MASPAQTAVVQNLVGTVINLTNGRAEVTKLFVTNSQAALIAFIQIFDAIAANVIIGTTVPIVTLAVTAQTSLLADFTSHPWLFDTRCSAASTTTALGGTGTASGVHINVLVN